MTIYLRPKHGGAIEPTSYRSGTGLYVFYVQKASRKIKKKVGWPASFLFNRVAAIALPGISVLNTLLVEPIRRLTDHTYARETQFKKQLEGTVSTVLTLSIPYILSGEMEERDIDRDLVDAAEKESWVLQLLKEGANPNYIHDYVSLLSTIATKTALGESCKRGHLKAIEAMIALNCDLNQKVSFSFSIDEQTYFLGVSPLTMCVRATSYRACEEEKERRFQIVSMLLKNGAKLSKGEITLYDAIYFNYPKLFKLLLSQGATPPAHGKRPYHRYTFFEFAMIYNGLDFAYPALKRKESVTYDLLKKTLAQGSWNSIGRISEQNLKRLFPKGTLVGSLLSLYLEEKAKYKERDDRGDISHILKKMLATSFPSERELEKILKLLIKIFSYHFQRGSYPEKNLFTLLGTFMPQYYQQILDKLNIAYLNLPEHLKAPTTFSNDPLFFTIEQGVWNGPISLNNRKHSRDSLEGSKMAQEMINFYSKKLFEKIPQTVSYDALGSFDHIKEIVRQYLITLPEDCAKGKDVSF